jgi:hypothetical protein
VRDDSWLAHERVTFVAFDRRTKVNRHLVVLVNQGAYIAAKGEKQHEHLFDADELNLKP